MDNDNIFGLEPMDLDGSKGATIIPSKDQVKLEGRKLVVTIDLSPDNLRDRFVFDKKTNTKTDVKDNSKKGFCVVFPRQTYQFGQVEVTGTFNGILSLRK